MASPVHQAAVSFALLAAGLLLATALFADVQEGIEGLDAPLFDRFVDEGADTGQTAAVLDKIPAGSLAGLVLEESIELDLPAGTSLTENGLVLAEELTVSLPAGSQLRDFDGELPAGTSVHPGARSNAYPGAIHLGEDTQLVLPSGIRFLLPDGGTLFESGASVAELRDGIRAGLHVTSEPARLKANRVQVLDAWNVRLSEGTRIEVPADWTPPPDWHVENGRLTESETITVPAGTPMQGGPAMNGYTAQDTAHSISWNEAAPAPSATGPAPGTSSATDRAAPSGAALWEPPVWLLGLTILAILIGAALWWRTRRTARSAATPRAARYLLRTRIDTRESDLPLAVPPKTAVRLALAIEERTTSGMSRPAEVRASIRIAGSRVHRGRLAPSGTTIPLPRLAPGDHALELRVRRRRLAPAHLLTATIRVATWPEHVARDWQELVDAIGENLHLPKGATPRQVRVALKRLAPATDAQEGRRIIAVFEESNYSPRDTGEAEWLAFTQATRRARAELTMPRSTHPAPEASRLLAPPTHVESRATG